MSNSTAILSLPDLGDNAQSGVIVRVTVQPGDVVSAGTTVLEVETDKVVLDIPVDMACRIDTIHVSEGDEVTTGTDLLVYEPQGTVHTPAPPATNSPPVTAPARSATVSTADNPPEATNPLPSSVDTPSGAVNGQSPMSPVVTERPVPSVDRKETGSSTIIPAGPSARRMAREIGVVIAQVQGQGPKGRISVDDVKSHARHQLTSPNESLAMVTPLPDQSEFGQVRQEKLTGIDKVTTDNMRRAWREIPHAWINARINIRALQRSRKRYKKHASDTATVPSITAFIVKALAMTAAEFPRFNASLDLESQSVVYREYLHVGVAVDTPRGLVVPVIRDVDTLNINAVTEQFAQVVERARQGALTPADMRGGSITLSNLGGFGGGQHLSNN